MKFAKRKTRIGTAIATASFLIAGAPVSAADKLEVVGLQNGTIGFVLAWAQWGIHQTENGKQECPDGFNDGPREQFKVLYPNGGTVEGTQLERESAARYPTEKEDKFPYHEVKGKVGIGMNIDGKVGPNDFTSPDGAKGIDNNLYRAIGCTRLFRGPDGTYYSFLERWVREMNYNRVLIELTNVDSLENDDQVDVAMYRGKDKLMMDAAAVTVMPGSSNRVDGRFSKRFTHKMKGKIVDGTLITDPTDFQWAWSAWYDHPGYYDFKQARIQLRISPNGDAAEGMVAGYSDVDAFYQQLVHSWSTHHSSYGSMSQPSLHRALTRLADGMPDEKGINTGISSSLMIKMVQVFIQHPEKSVAVAPARESARTADQ